MVGVVNIMKSLGNNMKTLICKICLNLILTVSLISVSPFTVHAQTSSLLQAMRNYNHNSNRRVTAQPKKEEFGNRVKEAYEKAEREVQRILKMAENDTYDDKYTINVSADTVSRPSVGTRGRRIKTTVVKFKDEKGQEIPKPFVQKFRKLKRQNKVLIKNMQLLLDQKDRIYSQLMQMRNRQKYLESRIKTVKEKVKAKEESIPVIHSASDLEKINNLNGEISNWKKINQELKEELAQLKSQINDYKKKQAGFEIEIAELKKQNEEQLVKISEQAAELDKIKQEEARLEKENAELRREVEESVLNIRILEEKVTAQKETIADLNEDIKNYKAGEEKYRAAIKSKDARITDLANQVNEISAERDELLNNLSDRDKRIAALEKIEKEYTNMKMEMQRNLKMIEQLNEERQKYSTTCTELYYQLGVAHTKSGEYDAAIESLEESVKAGNENAYAHYMLGLLYKHHSGNEAEAVKEINKCIRMNPDLLNNTKVKQLYELLNSR